MAKQLRISSAVAFLACTCCALGVATAQEANLTAAPAAAARPTSDPAAVAIVDNYLKVIGGRETLGAIRDRVTKFRNLKYQSTGETVAEIALYMKDHYLIREEWNIEGFDIKGKPLAFVQIYNGDLEEAWVKMLGTVSPLEGKTLNVFVWDKHMDDFFVNWEEAGYTLAVAGRGLVDDTPCDIVEVTDFSGRQKIRHFFSTKTGLLVKKEWMDTAANEKSPVKREQFYKEYRDLAFMDGSGKSIKFPRRLEIFADGDLDTERIFVDVRFNSGLSDKLFERPEGEAFDDFVKRQKELQAKEKEDATAATAAQGDQKTGVHSGVHGGKSRFSRFRGTTEETEDSKAPGASEKAEGSEKTETSEKTEDSATEKPAPKTSESEN